MTTERILTWNRYQEIYPKTTLKETTFNELNEVSEIFVVGQTVYFESEILRHEKLRSVYEKIIATQLSYFAENGIENDGIKSQNINGVSVTFADATGLKESPMLEMLINKYGLRSRQC